MVWIVVMQYFVCLLKFSRGCLVVLLLQAFDDCTTLSSTFKLLESFEGLLERDAIAAELAKKHKDMVAAFASDVKEVHELFLANRAFPVLSKNSPPHSGAVMSHAGSCI
jgi:dynein heavy chain